MRWLVALAIVLGLLAGADLLAERAIEQQAAERIRTRAGAAAATLDLAPFPVTLRLLAGTVPRATVTATDVTVPSSPVRLSRLTAAVTDVRIDVARIRELGDGLPPHAGGTFVAELTEAEISRGLRLPPPFNIAAIALDEGKASLTVANFAVVSATASIVGGDLVLALSPAIPGFASVPIDIPPLPFGAAVTAVAVHDGRIELTGTLPPRA